MSTARLQQTQRLREQADEMHYSRCDVIRVAGMARDEGRQLYVRRLAEILDCDLDTAREQFDELLRNRGKRTAMSTDIGSSES